MDRIFFCQFAVPFRIRAPLSSRTPPLTLPAKARRGARHSVGASLMAQRVF